MTKKLYSRSKVLNPLTLSVGPYSFAELCQSESIQPFNANLFYTVTSFPRTGPCSSARAYYAQGEHPLKSVIAFAIICAVLSLSAFAADKASLPRTSPAQSSAETAPAALAVPVASASVVISPPTNTASPTDPAAPPAVAVVPVTPARTEEIG